MSPADRVAFAAEIACLLEVSAAKPGNVTRFVDFPDTSYSDFLVSASIMGVALRRAAVAAVGTLVLDVVQDTARLVGRNTNLGLALLFAPLAKAALVGGHRSLRSRLHAVLTSLTPTDGQKIYEAIRLAAPGGLGEVERLDVRTTRRKIAPLAAMRAAMEQDSIAREYVTDFEITFTIGAPTLEWCVRTSGDPDVAIIQTYLTLLSRIPDSLIARKCGEGKARMVSEQAKGILAGGGAVTQRGRQRLAQWDRALRRRGNRLNPGTTADLIAAALFVVLLEKGIGFVLGKKTR